MVKSRRSGVQEIWRETASLSIVKVKVQVPWKGVDQTKYIVNLTYPRTSQNKELYQSSTHKRAELELVFLSHFFLAREFGAASAFLVHSVMIKTAAERRFHFCAPYSADD
jgi:hypothetical protein